MLLEYGWRFGTEMCLTRREKPGHVGVTNKGYIERGVVFLDKNVRYTINVQKQS